MSDTTARFNMPKGRYLLSHSAGLLPCGSEAHLQTAYFDQWREMGGDAWPSWLGEINKFRAVLARAIGAMPEDICPQSNVSAGLAKILHGLPRTATRTKLILCEEDFPSLGFVFQAAKRLGLELVFLPKGDAVQDPDVWDAAFADGAHLALITHSFSNRSARLPVAEICARARAHGVYSVVDVAQTLGAIPIDVNAWQADYLVGSCLKFSCGGPGAGFLWATPASALAADPLEVGWFSHEDPFAFNIHDFRPVENANRFWGGTPSIVSYVQAGYSLGILQEIGLQTIYEHNQALIDRLHASVGMGAIASAQRKDQRGNAVLVKVSDEATVMPALKAAGIFADFRDGCVRVSPHIYSSTDDIDALAAALQPYV